MYRTRPTALALTLGILLALPLSASSFSVWTDRTFTGPFPTGLIATSEPVVVNSSQFNSIRLIVDYLALVPDRAIGPANYAVQAIIEEEVVSGIWSPIARQFEGINDTTNGPRRILIYGPVLILDPGIDDVFFVQGKVLARISQTNGRAPEKIRIKLLVEDRGTTDLLQSIKVTVAGVRFNQ